MAIPHRALAALLLALAPRVHAQDAAPITAVTLYPGAATIVRTAHVEGGASRLVIPDLSTRFTPDSLRVEADAGIRIGQITTQDAARTQSANAAEAALEAKIQALKDQASALDVQAGAADIVKGYLERAGGVEGSAEHTRLPADAKSLTALLAAMNQAATEALSKKQQVAIQKREIDKKVAALERDLQRVRSESRDSRTVTIQLAAERAGAVRISYQLDSAGWKPAYRAALDSAASTVAVERLAQVSQKTGEDWKAVKLTLSTAQPRHSAFAPAPQPWLLSYVPPEPADERFKGSFAPAPAPVAAPMASAMRHAKDDAYEPPTFRTEGTFTTEFSVPQPVTLPADGREVSLALAHLSLPATQRVQVAPRLSTAAMATAEVARPEGVWPDGPLQLYRDGNYVGALAFHPQGTERWTLSFGRDDLLQVNVVPRKSDSATTGVFDKRNVRQIDERMTFRSNHRQPVELLVIEAAPVSTSDQVQVKTSFMPRPTVDSWEDRRGVVAWKRTIAPQENATIDVSYTIEYPKEGRVGGLR
jgi:uncharacterized protein (TIGR02231 family)